MSVLQTIAAALLAWVAAVLAVRWIVIPLLSRGPGGEPIHGLMWLGARTYARLMHRVRHIGHEELRRNPRPGPLIVVSNHTCAVDPLLVQTGCWFHVRWLMAADMMTSDLQWVWKQQDVIPVVRPGNEEGPAGSGDRSSASGGAFAAGAGSQPVREAIRHVRGGGVIGIFPEGRIVKPRGEIRPFYSGVGAIVSRTGARVLLVWVSGTPETRGVAEAFVRSSRSRVRYIALMDFTGERDAEAITQAIRKKLAAVSGWRLNDTPMPPPQ